MKNLEAIWAFERILLGSCRPFYHFDGRELEDYDNIPLEYVGAMKNDAEIFLIRKDNSIILMNACGIVMRRKLSSSELIKNGL